MVIVIVAQEDDIDLRKVLERHAVDIIQPDCTKVGGLTESWRIAWMAYEHNIQWVPHGWNTAIGLAADLHLSAAMPVARFQKIPSVSAGKNAEAANENAAETRNKISAGLRDAT